MGIGWKGNTIQLFRENLNIYLVTRKNKHFFSLFCAIFDVNFIKPAKRG